MMNENTDYWRNIPGFHARYRINRDGEIMTVIGGKVKMIRRRDDKQRSARYIVLFTPTESMMSMCIRDLMIKTFLYPAPRGYEWQYANGDPTDNRVENFVLVSKQKPKEPKIHSGCKVLMFNERNEIVKIYPNASAAARDNYVSQNAVLNRCNGTVQHPFELTGYSFKWAERR